MDTVYAHDRMKEIEHLNPDGSLAVKKIKRNKFKSSEGKPLVSKLERSFIGRDIFINSTSELRNPIAKDLIGEDSLEIGLGFEEGNYISPGENEYLRNYNFPNRMTYVHKIRGEKTDDQIKLMKRDINFEFGNIYSLDFSGDKIKFSKK